MEGLLQHAQPCCSCRSVGGSVARPRLQAPFQGHVRSQGVASQGGRSLLVAPPAAWLHMAPLTTAAPRQQSQQQQQQQQHSQPQQQPQQQQLRRRRAVITHAAAAAAGAEPPIEPMSTRVAAFMDAFWKFLRPHTIRGTLLGTTAVVSKALLENPQAIDWGLLPRALLGLVALLCGNGYIVGINQLYDVDIDVVNKPYLPVAAGELSPAAGWALVVALAVTGLAVTATNFGPFITSLYALGLTLGTVYSVPPFHLKRFAVPAFLIIATVRGFLLNFGVYYATRAALGLSFAWSPAISFITCFVTLFAVVIAITKDLPDVAGDRAHNISTFATRLGVRNVSLLAVALLLANYAGAIGLALTYPNSFRVPVMIGVHAILAALLLLRTAKLEAAKYTQKAIIDFYGWIWVLFYTEYACFVFV